MPDESGLGILCFLQKLVDSLAVFLGVIENEMNFGSAAQLDSLGQLVANVTDCREETCEGILLLGFASYHADEYTRVLEVGCHANFGDRDKPLDARVLQFTDNHD